MKKVQEQRFGMENRLRSILEGTTNNAHLGSGRSLRPHILCCDGIWSKFELASKVKQTANLGFGWGNEDLTSFQLIPRWKLEVHFPGM